MWKVVVGSFLLAIAGCNDSMFHCHDSAQCVLEGEQGTCEPSGFCSFADHQCASGQRYGEAAPQGLRGSCTEFPPPSGSTSTGSTPDDSWTGDSGTGSGDGGHESSGATMPTGTDADGSEESGDTGGTCVRVVDEFDDGVVGGGLWDTYAPHSPPLMFEAGGELIYDVWAQQPRLGVLATGLPNFEASEITLHVTGLPVSFPARMSLLLISFDANHVIEFRVQGGLAPEVLAFDTGLQVATLTLDGGADELWMRLVGDLGSVEFQYSVDGQHFETLGDTDATFIAEPLRTQLQGGSVDILGADQTIAVSRFEFCSLPG